jgi:cyclopropane fatty-acyl-phospholipid synthase-like methyltransferase
LVWTVPENVKKEKEYLDRFITNSNEEILEYGCGTGEIAKYLASKGHKILATEYSDVAVRRIKSENPPFKIIETSAPSDIKDKKFDTIVCIGVFHHQPPDIQKKFLESFSKMIKSGGQIILMGWDVNDSEFLKTPKRISDETKKQTWTINHLEKVMPKYGLRIENSEPMLLTVPPPYNIGGLMRCYVLKSY